MFSSTAFEAGEPGFGELVDRAVGSFLGVAVGDALGATVEFLTPEQIRHDYGVHDRMRGGGWLHLKPGQVTDDTEMSLCVARALVSAGGCRPHEIMRRFVAWADQGPVDVGATCLSGIRRYREKGVWSAPRSKLHGGNGALMRMAPVALFTVGDDEALLQCARVQAHLTHNHPLSDAACVAMGAMTHAALLGSARDDILRIALAAAQRFPELAFEPYPARTGGYVAHTFATACHDFFTTESFEDCLRAVVNRGGDSDTNAAVTGMLAGAHYGAGKIPAPWADALDPALRAEVEALAESLVRLSPLGRRRGRREEDSP